MLLHSLYKFHDLSSNFYSVKGIDELIRTYPFNIRVNELVVIVTVRKYFIVYYVHFCGRDDDYRWQ